MTPKEKAKELVNLCLNCQLDELNKSGTLPIEEVEIKIAIKCALIACDEIISCSVYYNHEIKANDIETRKLSDKYFFTYWKKVKQEIENLKQWKKD